MKATDFNSVFEQTISHYHINDDIKASCPELFSNAFKQLLCKKNWIDTVQWHLEDLIREPSIDPVEALAIKREIDASNQRRTDMVEKIDDYFFELYRLVSSKPNVRLNTETPAWALDRLSILHLKIFHMREETQRQDATHDHIMKCNIKLETLNTQLSDLSLAIDQLLIELEDGSCVVKTYKQMKMYNDAELNPVLRKQ